MVDSRDWDALLARAEKSGTPVVAIGDPRQLGSVGPGGLYAVMVDHPELPTAELEQVWRMEAEWEKAASLKLRVMDPAAADAYAAEGRIRDHDDLEELLDGLAAGHADGLDVLILAGANMRVDELNDAMQARIVGEREGGDELVVRWDDDEGVAYERTVGVGDRIRTRRNAYDLVASRNEPVVNGATWEVTHVRTGVTCGFVPKIVAMCSSRPPTCRSGTRRPGGRSWSWPTRRRCIRRRASLSIGR